MHPLTPLFKGGLVLIIVGGFAANSFRDRIVAWFVNLFTPRGARYDNYGGDPVDWVLSHNLLLVAALIVLGVVVVLSLIFWFVWRFQEFRITGDHVEIRKGIIFRSQRRAPLDRVQAVNLTRPFPARIIGLAKLEVAGAGTDADVPLEYLSTAKAEAVRADILRLASGARAVREAALRGAPGAAESPRAQFLGSVNQGVTGLIEGVDLADVVPESVVKIPTGRLVGSQIIAAVLWLVFFALLFVAVMAVVVISALRDGDPKSAIAVPVVALGVGVPLVLATIGVTWAQISKSLRYSIAPTPDGVRITFGLFTTVTETIPPGRVFAAEVSQSLLWRPFGWWTVKINRMSGKSASQQQSSSGQQFNIVLPVGKRADVERVLGLILPELPAADLPLVWEHGVLGPQQADPYHRMVRRSWWRRPISWRRHGFAVTDFGILLRRGRIWRKLAIFPLARLQGISISQGPIARLQRVAWMKTHSVIGPVLGEVVGIDRDELLTAVGEITRKAPVAALRDHSHRWAEHASAEPVRSFAPAMAGFGAPTGSGAALVPGAFVPPPPPAAPPPPIAQAPSVVAVPPVAPAPPVPPAPAADPGVER